MLPDHGSEACGGGKGCLLQTVRVVSLETGADIQCKPFFRMGSSSTGVPTWTSTFLCFISC